MFGWQRVLENMFYGGEALKTGFWGSEKFPFGFEINVELDFVKNF